MQFVKNVMKYTLKCNEYFSFEHTLSIYLVPRYKKLYSL